jgi:tRNA threonylcarbamoyladenosine biosynthesis protein TsaB
MLAAIDARMGEVYLGEFIRDADGRVLAVGPEIIVAPASAPRPALPVFGVGTGFSAESGALVARLGETLAGFDAAALPHAADLAWLAVEAFARGEAVAPDQLEPAYLRDKVALTLVEQGKA